MTRRLLAPLDLLYLAGLQVKQARDRRLGSRRLTWPVASVGNLSVGGAGKTPLVIALIRLLSERGWNIDVLSRGYRRQRSPGSSEAEEVDPVGSARRFGDEPLMIARLTGAQVFVGADRYAAGLLAESRASRASMPADRLSMHLLDDGFQHRRLARDLDIVVMNRKDLSDSLLPRGRLREPLSSLVRADAVVLRREDEDLAETLQRYLRPGTPLWSVTRRLSLPGGLGRVAAFSAIARPQEFYRSLEVAGAEVVARKSFRDHHWYSDRDIEAISSLGKRVGCDHFVTTEKDVIRLEAAMKARLERVAPLVTAGLSVEIAEEDRVAEEVAAFLKRARVPS